MGATSGGGHPNDTAQAERRELADLLLEVGPDAPTCCAGWTTRDLAAHLWLRENRFDAALGIGIPALAGWTRHVQDGVARRDWPELVRQVRGGPPRWSVQRAGRVDDATNTLEYFVHHEDVRRAEPGWKPRALPEDRVAALWASLVRAGGLLTRASPVGVVVRPTDGPAAGASRELHRARTGRGTVTLVGPVGECALAVFGRPAGLGVEGSAADADAFQAYPR